MEEVIYYIDRKNYVYGCMKSFKELSQGSAYTFDELYDIDARREAEISIACGLYELEKEGTDGLEDDVESWMTDGIYRYLRGDFKGMIPDEELLIKDIKKISSMMTLRFKDLRIYDPKDKIKQSLIDNL